MIITATILEHDRRATAIALPAIANFDTDQLSFLAETDDEQLSFEFPEPTLH